MNIIQKVRRGIARLVLNTMSLQEFARAFAAARDLDDGVTESGIDPRMPLSKSAWAHAAVGVIADSVASIQFIIESADGNRRIEQGELVDFLQRPNPEQEWTEFVVSTITTLLSDGMVFWEPEFAKGPDALKVKALWVRSIDEFRPITAVDHLGREIAVAWERIGDQGQAVQRKLIPGIHIFDWKLENPYSYVYGLSPLSAAGYAVYTDIGIGVYNKAFLDHGAEAGVVFTSEDPAFGNEQAKEAQEVWQTKHGGAKRSHQAAFLGHGLRPYPTKANHKDAEVVALKALSKSEILGAYKVPDIILGSSRSASGVQIGGSNRRPEQENFWLGPITTFANGFASRFNKIVARGYGTERGRFWFENVPILQDRRLERAKEAREWIAVGATYNDVNEKFQMGLDPQPTGDDWWVADNMVPARFILEKGPEILDVGTMERTPSTGRRQSGESDRADESAGRLFDAVSSRFSQLAGCNGKGNGKH